MGSRRRDPLPERPRALLVRHAPAKCPPHAHKAGGMNKKTNTEQNKLCCKLRHLSRATQTDVSSLICPARLPLWILPCQVLQGSLQFLQVAAYDEKHDEVAVNMTLPAGLRQCERINSPFDHFCGNAKKQAVLLAVMKKYITTGWVRMALDMVPCVSHARTSAHQDHLRVRSGLRSLWDVFPRQRSSPTQWRSSKHHLSQRSDMGTVA